ncbi:MAG: glycoside hydrolase family 9 protein [Polyangiaceae bacterium]|nr:glycoside hydrolase family 9 protein [Polyangiaceae bacterium]
MRGAGWHRAAAGLCIGVTALALAAAACDESESETGTGGAGVGGAGAHSQGGGGSGASAASGGFGGAPAEPVSPYIVVDQFGYRPGAEKLAVVRDPVTGYDAAESFTPGSSYALVDAQTSTAVLTGAVAAWNGGAEDVTSGDRASWFDFSAVTTPGFYYVLDVEQGVRSPVFRIADDVYAGVLRHALRTFFYQRAGQAKAAPYAEPGWTDAASHVGPGQDHACRLYSAPNDASTERDLWGGWYDAGDYNKYTSWTADYVVGLLRAYRQSPAAWGDDAGIPESGNGIPDVLDEARWGLDWLVRMQNVDGSVLSIVGVGHASPPSAATEPSYYGPASTSSTLSAAAAFGWGATVFRSLGEPATTTYGDELEAHGTAAFGWASANPGVTFYNNDAGQGSVGLGAGQQETDDYGRLVKRVAAAAALFEATGTAAYRSAFDALYDQVHLLQWSWSSPFEAAGQEAVLEYTRVPGATPAVVAAILQAYRSSLDGGDNLPAHAPALDPYLAHISDYTWGSNSVKSLQGLLFLDAIAYDVDPTLGDEPRRDAERYVHYVHGVNPLGLVYLTNMASAGAYRSVNELYHSWFADGSAAWDRVGVSTYGPAPGFLTGGPNPSYDWDGCCPNGCGSAENDAVCTSESLEPPRAQPPQKSYKDFNTSWPLNSWEVTENSNGYQVAYLRLLASFVP